MRVCPSYKLTVITEESKSIYPNTTVIDARFISFKVTINEMLKLVMSIVGLLISKLKRPSPLLMPKSMKTYSQQRDTDSRKVNCLS